MRPGSREWCHGSGERASAWFHGTRTRVHAAVHTDLRPSIGTGGVHSSLRVGVTCMGCAQATSAEQSTLIPAGQGSRDWFVAKMSEKTGVLLGQKSGKQPSRPVGTV